MNAPIIRFAGNPSDNINIDDNVMYNVILCQVGEAKGHGVHLELSFLQDAEKLAKKSFKDGLPSYFGHVLSGLGKKLGKLKDFRLKGDQLVADLHFYKAADNSPNGQNMASYVKELAREDPKAIMMSIAFIRDHYYQYDSAGKKVQVWYWDETNRSWVSPFKEFGKIYVSIKELRSCDVVDQGAATDSMFSEHATNTFFDFVAQPGFPAWLEEHFAEIPVINDFYAEKYGGQSIFNKFKKLFSMSTEIEQVTPAVPEPAVETSTTPAASSDEQSEYKEWKDKLAELQKSNKDLLDRIDALSKLPAATETATPETQELSDQGNSWDDDPINQKAQKQFDRKTVTSA